MSNKDLTEVEDAVMNIYNRGIIKGGEHATPSKETLNLINEIKQDMQKQETEIQLMRKDIQNLTKIMTTFIEKAPSKFASKLTQTIVYSVCALAGAGIVTALIISVIGKAQF